MERETIVLIQISTCASGKLYGLTAAGTVYDYDAGHFQWVPLSMKRSA